MTFPSCLLLACCKNCAWEGAVFSFPRELMVALYPWSRAACWGALAPHTLGGWCPWTMLFGF